MSSNFANGKRSGIALSNAGKTSPSSRLRVDRYQASYAMSIIAADRMILNLSSFSRSVVIGVLFSGVVDGICVNLDYNIIPYNYITSSILSPSIPTSKFNNHVKENPPKRRTSVGG